jgi:NAD(P)-dependent dehydrogenase (short-subunit alcohol dehydrogenase family)
VSSISRDQVKFELTDRERSSKSALHGLVHWLASAYAKSGVTVNGVAPALIQGTTMLPGNNEELAKSKLFLSYSHSF